MACYFAPDLAFISFFFGIVNGTCIAGIYVVVSALCCQHFERWTATASSIVWASQSLNVFFGPAAANYFLAEFGTPEMFLLFGALTLHGLPAALVTKSPPWQTRKRAIEPTLLEAILPKRTMDVSTAEATRRALPVVQTGRGPPLPPDAAVPQVPLSHNQQITLVSQSQQQDYNIPTFQDATSCSELPVPHGKNAAPKSSSIQSYRIPTKLRTTVRVFVSPMFYLDSLSLGVQVYAMTTFFQVYVDLAQDKGIEASQAIFLMHVYSISDFVVRVVSGVIVDRGYVELETVIMLSFLGCVLACEAVAWSTSLAHLLLSSFVYGASAAIVLSLAPSLIISDFKGQPVPVVLGGMMFFSGLLLLTRPVLVGYFRDNLGKYDGLMHTMAVPNALFAVIWCWKMISRRRRITIAA
ncbi:uncharacterized protein LOC8025101 [Ixodes scapularis]|uniref:uncharacterized protein LOC8025101 n=1 Tax=Ixodes scapularis TaxID=6945 RepID=UPI001C381D72|nr:uncharacterized protein LOC8025101 [Ixodes scapularis]